MSPATVTAATRPLLMRLWREHVRRYRSLLLTVLALTVILAALQALYPIVIDHAFTVFAY
jgi:hypothetical protein